MSEDNKVNIHKVAYPSLDRILQLQAPGILLGKEIFWTEKRDGSNIGVYLDGLGNPQIRSRNQCVASSDFQHYFKETEEYSCVIELLKDMNEYDNRYMIFGELLVEGRSPARFEMHERHEFVVFDIYDHAFEYFLPYTMIHQYVSHYDVPIVELFGTSKHTTMESLFDFRDEMFEICQQKNREGVVGKTLFKSQGVPVNQYFKEKIDTPKFDKVPRQYDSGVVMYPELEDSEVYGAINKVLVDFGVSEFKEKKLVMPRIAEYVRDECVKHFRRPPKRSLFNYYMDVLGDIE